MNDLIDRLRAAKADEEQYASEQDFWHGELLGEAADALAALAPATQAVPGGWHTMDSAPKDGTRIIGSADEESVFACQWFADEDGDGYWLAYGSDVVNPKRWMSMPLAGQVSLPASGVVEALREALAVIVEFCDDPNQNPNVSLALGLANLLPAAREALARLSSGRTE
ncbi:MAG: hypothetical protein E5Y67_12550 [Mesorhizobium sp.]|uniref:hypothetical protein n=1 Tax=Mesorhizobium sp. TaxID=1871066 RepID=UPI00120C5595|nr:hypothetical protein [Mesorhizobium sp.]TIM14502.1 MAG: hypothetical protein E5Y67_12550 [Mesorhizobium sp.]